MNEHEARLRYEAIRDGIGVELQRLDALAMAWQIEPAQVFAALAGFGSDEVARWLREPPAARCCPKHLRKHANRRAAFLAGGGMPCSK